MSQAPESGDTGEPLVFSSRNEARYAFEGSQQRAANRFCRGATAKSIGFKATPLPGGGYRLEFFSPANNPGYGKRYVQDIGGKGVRVREFKETLGPGGVIETKWVFGGPHDDESSRG